MNKERVFEPFDKSKIHSGGSVQLWPLINRRIVRYKNKWPCIKWFYEIRLKLKATCGNNFWSFILQSINLLSSVGRKDENKGKGTGNGPENNSKLSLCASKLSKKLPKTFPNQLRLHEQRFLSKNRNFDELDHRSFFCVVVVVSLKSICQYVMGKNVKLDLLETGDTRTRKRPRRSQWTCCWRQPTKITFYPTRLGFGFENTLFRLNFFLFWYFLLIVLREQCDQIW